MDVLNLILKCYLLGFLNLTAYAVFFAGLASVILSGVKELAIPEDFRLNTANRFFKDGFLQLAFPDDDD